MYWTSLQFADAIKPVLKKSLHTEFCGFNETNLESQLWSMTMVVVSIFEKKKVRNIRV